MEPPYYRGLHFRPHVSHMYDMVGGSSAERV
jgi:hypothetical protein